MSNAQEQEDHKLPKDDGTEDQVKNDVQHPQINESQQMTGGSPGSDNSYDQEIKPNTGGSRETGADLEQEAEKGHS